MKSIWLTAAFVLLLSNQAAAQPQVHIIYMGGNDCPPCVAWRREELPKEVKPFKDKLDLASNGITGSPQTAILVDGEVHD